MFTKSALAVCCGLAASALAAGGVAPVALAQEDDQPRVVLRDGTGDVWKVNLRTSHWTLVGDLPAADVRSAAIRHRDQSVVVRMRFENLRRIGVQTYNAGIATPDDDFFVKVTSKPGTRVGQHAFYDSSGGSRVGCASLSHRIDYATDTVNLQVPRKCLGVPRWVTINVGNSLVVGDRPHRHHYADNPHNHQAYANVGTRRIYRG